VVWALTKSESIVSKAVVVIKINLLVFEKKE